MFKETIFSAVFGLTVLALMPAHALQDEDAAPASEPPTREEEDIITIFGGGGPRDEAMAAFMRGDYPTAELEFGNNLRCAERVEMMEDFAFEAARGGQVAADAGASGAAPVGGGDVAPQPQSSGSDFRDTQRPDADDVAARSCDMPAYQIYMIGMSQVKQGKNEEAKANFYRVIAMSNDERFFDAHYRIGLLELLDGNVDKAEERLAHLKILQQRCQRRGERCEWRGELDEAVAFLDAAVTNATGPSAG
ncbi:tetratricopeptide repeat protein [Aquisalinus flavus]|uniref:Tetratricopeptide repeat protein n=1 Tax=Aquisalinus flavus TaxID=1526572 RepID=A0A8J2Y7Q7_9PROT|nr:tetratricopeptide repeat protein [Aquisalinus flavus]MBD0425205.1 hypothetical protein [Aquisalinus flavus]UNE49133.1 hypothetical protein FF099_14270 [Aquisalinus flavus]GGD17909.1 hypothetical protein GCM10011342_28410 [Aquisalinus flavus]